MNDLYTETRHRFNQLGIKESFQVKDHQRLYYTFDGLVRVGHLSLHNYLVRQLCNYNFYNFIPPHSIYKIEGDLI